MNETASIYCLSDPRVGEVRYVGKSHRPEKRFREHLASASSKQTHRDCWINSIRSEGYFPVMEILDAVPSAEWEFWEREYIKFFRGIGCHLTNSTDGGEGISAGAVLSESHREKIGAFQRGKPKSAEQRAKMSVAAKGKIRSPEHCKNISEARKGTKASTETRQKMSEARCGSNNGMFGRHHSEAAKLKIGAKSLGKPPGNKGKHPSEETRVKMRAAQQMRRLRELQKGGRYF